MVIVASLNDGKATRRGMYSDSGDVFSASETKLREFVDETDEVEEEETEDACEEASLIEKIEEADDEAGDEFEEE